MPPTKKYMAIARFRVAKEEKQLRAKSEETGGERAGAQVRECGRATEKTGAHETIPQGWQAQAPARPAKSSWPGYAGDYRPKVTSLGTRAHFIVFEPEKAPWPNPDQSSKCGSHI